MDGLDTGEVYRTARRSLRKVCGRRKWVIDDFSSDDIVQDAVVRVCRAYDAERGSLRQLVATVVEDLCIDLFRRRDRLKKLSEAYAAEMANAAFDGVEVSEELDIASQRAEMVARLIRIAEITNDLRAWYALQRSLEGADMRTIAEELGVHPANARRATRRPARTDLLVAGSVIAGMRKKAADQRNVYPRPA